MCIPVALILLGESMKNTVQSKKEIEKKTGLEVFGEISVMPKSKRSQVIDLASRSFISEQIRMLRSNMQYTRCAVEILRENGLRILLKSAS